MVNITSKNRNYLFSALIVLLLSALIQIFSLTSSHESVEVAVSRPLAFFLRSKIVHEELDSRIKIFAMDDRSVSGLGMLDLELSTWQSVIYAVGNQLPKGIFVDKLFDKMYSSHEIKDFNNLSLDWKSPVYPIVFVYPGKIPYRKPVSDLKMPKHMSDLSLSKLEDRREQSNLTAYGADSLLLSSFQAAGHTVYNGDGKGALFYKTEDEKIIPHLGLLGAESVLVKDKVIVNGKDAFVDSKFEFIVNFLPKHRFLKRSFSLLEVVDAAKRGKAITPVNEGDFVFILPAMFTGNTDWRETPFGSMPGGYYAVSVLNSVLTGKWIRNIKDPGFAVVFTGFVMVMFGFKASPTKLILATSLLMVGLVLISLALFILANMLLPWFTIVFVIVLNSIILLVGINQDASIEKVRVDSELATAKIVHHTFFPPIYFKSEHLEFSSFYESSSECGGDWWMHSAISKDVEYVLIGDAVGHGVPAALVASVAFAVNSTMADLKHTKRIDMPGPKEFLEILDSVLKSMKTRNAVMTFQVAKFDFIDETMELANAGHTFPMIIPADANDDRLKVGKKSLVVRLPGNPLGLDIQSVWKSKKIGIRPGDRMIFYSDGIIENRGGKNYIPLKVGGLTSILEASADQEINEMKKEVLKNYLLHVGSHVRDDDATLVVAGYQRNQSV